MKIKEIRLIPLFGHTPDGGWDQTFNDPDRNLHTLVEVVTDEGLTGVGSVYTSTNLVKGAVERGDLYAESMHRPLFMSLLQLQADRPDLARQEALEATSRWTQRSFHAQHLFSQFGLVHADLHDGNGRAAWARVSEVWPKFRRSGIRVNPTMRKLATEMRGRAALAAAVEDRESRGSNPSVRPAELFRVAQREATGLERSKVAWFRPFGSLLHAGIHAAQAQPEQAVQALRRAIDAFDAGDMAFQAVIARWRLGELLGEEGRDLLDAARSWMEGEGVRNPARLVAAMAAHRANGGAVLLASHFALGVPDLAELDMGWAA